MKVLVIGAAGKTGKAVVEQAVAAGHEVTAFVRQADEYQVQNVRLIEGDAADGAAIDRAFLGQDAVIDTIGGKTPYKTATLESSAAGAIIKAMQRNGVRRLVVTSMLGVGKARRMQLFLSAYLWRAFCAARTKTKQQWSRRSNRAIWIG